MRREEMDCVAPAPRAARQWTACASLPLALLAACGGVGPTDDAADIVSSPAPLGTISGPGIVNMHLANGAAETAMSQRSPSSGRHVITYNWLDLANVAYTSTDRFILKNASEMGWSNWRPDGVITQSGRVPTVAGWPVLWGDPAITRSSSDGNFVYISNLAIPSNKFPAQGSIQGPVDPETLPVSYCGAYLGGACIARSTNDGQTFTLSAQDCLQRVSSQCPFGTFYDGGSMTSGQGRIYAAFFDFARQRNDVWMAASNTASFQKITDLDVTAVLHPRIKYGRRSQFPSIGDVGALYMVYQNTNAEIRLARYNGVGTTLTSTWTQATWTTSVPRGSFNDVHFSDRILRTGPEYDFDIGFNDAGQPEIRIVYSVNDGSGLLHMEGASCVPDYPGLTCAKKSPLWATAPLFGASSQWSPAIAFGQAADGDNTWQVSFHRTVPGTDTLELWRGNISDGSMSLFLQDDPQKACPDTRGYWGDYDGMAAGASGQFYRGFTDSSHGTCQMWAFKGQPQTAALSGWVAF